jgi:hypothetical protein
MPSPVGPTVDELPRGSPRGGAVPDEGPSRRSTRRVDSRTVDFVDKPWDARVLYKDDPDFRMTTFGDFGVLYFKVDEATELITIFNVTWAG